MERQFLGKRKPYFMEDLPSKRSMRTIACTNSGTQTCYIIYGTRNTSPYLLELNLPLVNTQGFAIRDYVAGDAFGTSAASAGDFNGDGLDDVIIGAPQINNGGNAGKVYIIYGTNSKPDTYFAPINVSSLNATQGFYITDGTIGYAPTNNYFGTSVSSAGDFNVDGLNDVIIGTSSALGNSYILYGTNSTPSSMNVASLTATQGFTITGANTKNSYSVSVASAGFFYGGGFTSDVVIGTQGTCYVVYGVPSIINSPTVSLTNAPTNSANRLIPTWVKPIKLAADTAKHVWDSAPPNYIKSWFSKESWNNYFDSVEKSVLDYSKSVVEETPSYHNPHFGKSTLNTNVPTINNTYPDIGSLYLPDSIISGMIGK